MDNLFLRSVTSERPSGDPDTQAYRTNITAVPHDNKGDGNACHPCLTVMTRETGKHTVEEGPVYIVRTKGSVVFRWLCLSTLTQRKVHVHIYSTARLP